MTERSLVGSPNPRVELAHHLRVPCDIVDVQRLNDSQARIYQSLRYGAFQMAYGPSKASPRNSPGMQSQPTAAYCRRNPEDSARAWTGLVDRRYSCAYHRF
jgi:hypothetical protein